MGGLRKTGERGGLTTDRAAIRARLWFGEVRVVLVMCVMIGLETWARIETE